MRIIFLTGLVLAGLSGYRGLAQSTPNSSPAPTSPAESGRQSGPPDRIYRKNQVVIPCYIVETTATEIRYRLSLTPGSPVQQIARTQVLRVERQTPGRPAQSPFDSRVIAALTPLDNRVQQADNPLRQLLDSLRARPAVTGLRIKLKNPGFAAGAADLSPAGKAYLDTLAGALNALPSLLAEVGSHTDNAGQAADNLTLSERRAQAVRDYLVTSGRVAAKRLTAKGYGQTKPVAANTVDANREQNRRTELQITGLDNAQVSKVYRSSGEILTVPFVYFDETSRSVLYKMTDATALVELSCAEVTKIAYANGREQATRCRDQAATAAPVTNLQPRFSSHKDAKINVKLLGGAGYMIAPEAWTDKTNGYAHVFGFGGMALLTYRLTPGIGIALEPGYWQFSTQVNYKASDDGSLIKQYNSKATQLSLFVALPVYINQNIYLMPEGGVNMLKISAGFDGKNDSFSGLQPGFGGSLGYTSDRSKQVQFDLGLFYRAGLKLNALPQQYGVPMMHYAGIRAGLGFSL